MKRIHMYCRSSIVLLAMVVALGCANLQSIHHRFNAYDSHESVAIDVKQRVVLVGKNRDQDWVACAEPSPDALTVIGSALALEATTPEQIQARLAGATAESGASIGLRTQTIQLLRDSMYRLCEGYMNGALSWDDFQQLQRRYQDSMVALLAIEQLTGATTPRQAVLTSESEGDTGGILVEAQRNLDELIAMRVAKEKDVAAAQKSLAEAEKALNDAKAPSDEQKAKLENDRNDAARRVEDARTALSAAEANVNAAKEKVERARGPVASVRAGGSLSERIGTQMDEETAKVVAGAVSQIVIEFLQKDYLAERCLKVLTDSQGSSPSVGSEESRTSAEQFCMQLLRERTAESKSRTPI